MKLVIYSIYYLGVVVFALCTTYMELIPAFITTVVAPLMLMQIAEMTGKVRIMRAPQPTTPLELASYHGLSDEEAINKFGWSMIVEMDKCIEEAQSQLEVMQKSREQMAAMHKKENK